jgi:hypothetical protein
MGKRTAESMRHLESKARGRKEEAARSGDMLGAMEEQAVETEYGRRADRHEQPGAKGW